MGATARKGFPVVGIMFLAVALIEFLRGDNWVVWLILGFLFGGFAIFGMRGEKEMRDGN